MLKNSLDIIKETIFDQNLPLIQYNLDQLLSYRQNMLDILLKFWQINLPFQNLPIIEKGDMKFYKSHIPRKKITTSGTTAAPFEYFVSEDYFKRIEIDLHYKYVLKEFDLDKPISVLRINVFPHKGMRGYQKIEYKGKNFWLKRFIEDNDYFLTHAATGIFFHFIYYPDEIDVFCDYLINVFFKENKVDVFLSPFSFISVLLSFMKSPEKIAYLISNINESVLEEEIPNVLKICDYFCDHMRCWDGGMTFITCKHGNKHILDYLSYVESIDGKLVSTDYFNTVGRFIRYWNGDYCEINEKWDKCDCGRYYRKFYLEGNRKPFLAVNNMTSWEVGGVLRVWLQEMSQAICYKDKIVVVTVKDLDIEKQEKIKSLLKTNIEFKANCFEHSGRFGKILKVVNKA